MAQATLGDVFQYLRRICAAQEARGLPDRELLTLFLVQREQAAFAALVHRHGPMVLRVCRRLLGDFHAAEDAFQATFVVLARRAASIRKKESVGTWLYGVARRVAAKARAQAATRRGRERRLADMAQGEPLDDLTWQELHDVLDEEIGRLPEKYQAALIFCYFEGKTHAQAAKELGWPKNTLTSRLERGRELLRQQLVRRGITLSVAALATALSEEALAAPVGAMLAINTVKAAMSIAAGKAVAGGCLSAQALALAEEAIAGMVGIKGKLIVMLLVLGLGVGGAGLAGHGAFTHEEQPAKVEKAQLPAGKTNVGAKQKKEPPPATDLYGDPLPEGAVARLGTVRFRHGDDVLAIAYSPDGKILASGGSNGVGVCLWDAATGRLLHEVTVGGACITLAFSLDGKLICTGNGCLIDVATGQQLVGRVAGLGAVAFAPDGKTVATARKDATMLRVILSDVVTRRELRRFDVETGGGPKPNHFYYWDLPAFSPDGKAIASSGGDGTVQVRDLVTGKELRRFAGNGKPIWSVAFAPSGKVLAAVGEDGAIRLWDLMTGRLLNKLKADEGIPSEIAFSPDGKLLASAGFTGTIRLWDTATGKETRHWVTNLGRMQFAFSPDGKVLAAGGGLGIDIRRWDTSTGREIDPVDAPTGIVWSLQFSQDGTALFSRGIDLKVLEWDLATKQQRRPLFDKPIGPPPSWWRWGAVDLSPDAKLLALTRWNWSNNDPKQDRGIRLWDTAEGKEIRVLTGHQEEVVVDSVKLSPDAKLLASGGKDGIRVWDVMTGKELHCLEGVGERPAFAFSPDSKLLAYTGFDNTVRL